MERNVKRLSGRDQVIRRKYVFTIISLIFSVVSLAATSLAWFIFARKGDIINNQIIADPAFSYTYNSKLDGVTYTNNDMTFNDMFPGALNSRKFTFDLTNNGNEPFVIDLYLKAAQSSEEVPYIDTTGKWGTANTYYYFGSQIALKNITLTIDGVTPSNTNSEGSFLVSTSSEGLSAGQVNGVSSPISLIPRLNLFSNVIIPAGKTLNGSIDFAFIDNGTNQNVYMEDWASSGHTSRTIEGHLREG